MKAVQHNYYWLAGGASCGISLCWLQNVNGVVKDSKWGKAGYVIGATLGSITSVFMFMSI